MSITPEMLKELRAQLSMLLEQLAPQLGLSSLKVGGARYTADSFTMKIEGIAEGGISPEVQRYERLIGIKLLPPLGSVFTYAGKQYRTAGLNKGSKVICVRGDDKPFLFPMDIVLSLCRPSVAA